MKKLITILLFTGISASAFAETQVITNRYEMQPYREDMYDVINNTKVALGINYKTNFDLWMCLDGAAGDVRAADKIKVQSDKQPLLSFEYMDTINPIRFVTTFTTENDKETLKAIDKYVMTYKRVRTSKLGEEPKFVNQLIHTKHTTCKIK